MTMHITRRTLLFAATTATLLPRAAFAASPAITVHKDPNCGCCTDWVTHLQANGFQTKVVETGEINRVKARLGVPSELASCHTAQVGGYVIEGHVPAGAIRKLLAEKPQALGLAAPGMPSGSPGMTGEPEPFDVILFAKDTRSVYARFKGETEI